MATHSIHPELLERQVRVLAVGCGGTGSAVVAGLPYLHHRLWPAVILEGCMSRSWTAIRSHLPTASASLSLGRRSVSTKR
jgi:hypothetical protein